MRVRHDSSIRQQSIQFQQMAKAAASQNEESKPDDKPAARSLPERIFALVTWAKQLDFPLEKFRKTGDQG